MSRALCPLIKLECKEQDCVMFKDEHCILVKFFSEFFSEGPNDLETSVQPYLDEITSKVDRTPVLSQEEIKNYERPHSDYVEIPDWLKKRTPEELKEDILEYAKKEYIDQDLDIPYFIRELFFYDKEKIELTRLPIEFVSKLELAEELAQREIKKAEKEKLQKLNSIRASTIPPVAEQNNLEKQIDNECPVERKEDKIRSITTISEPIGEIGKSEDKKDVEKKTMSNLTSRTDDQEVPQWILEITPKEISVKILEFLDAEDPSLYDVLISQPDRLFEFFWTYNGIEEFSMPSNIYKKMLSAKYYVSEELLIRRLKKEDQDREKAAKEKILRNPKLDLRESPETLADEMLKFITLEYPKMSLQDQLSNVHELFWQYRRNKVGEGYESEETRQKFEKVFTLAKNRLNEEKIVIREQKLLSEKADLQLLAKKCASWAKLKGMKKIAKYEIHAFLIEENLDLMEETKRDLFSMANVILKSNKLV